jgi:hypothetical protein
VFYYEQHVDSCAAFPTCAFDGQLDVPSGFTQAESFLSGFTLEVKGSADKLDRAIANVASANYDKPPGKIQVTVGGMLNTENRRDYSYRITFGIVFTSANAKFTSISNSCTGSGSCDIKKSLKGVIPSGLEYMGLGTRHFDIGVASGSGAIDVNTLSMHIEDLVIKPRDIDLDYRCRLHDAAGANGMACEWAASIFALDPGEMERNNSTIFPQYTLMVLRNQGSQSRTNQGQSASGGPISGFLDGLEGVTFANENGGEEPISLIDASADEFELLSNPPNTSSTHYQLYAGETFGQNTFSSQFFTYQLSRLMVFMK